MDEVTAKPQYSWVCPNKDCHHENTLDEDFEETIVAECELCGEPSKITKE